ncbi:MAG: zf-HC2 domain-containing protein [candidate division WOR-3 bacterium]
MKMKCAKVKRMLSSFLDGELKGKAKLDLEAHLTQCSDCRNELAGLKADRELLSSVSVPELSPYFLTRTVARIRELNDQKEWVWARRLVYQAGAAVLVLLGIGLGLFLGSNLAQNNGISQEIATLNAEPSIEELFAFTDGAR